MLRGSRLGLGVTSNWPEMPSHQVPLEIQAELGAERWEGSSAFGQGDLHDALRRERRICLL